MQYNFKAISHFHMSVFLYPDASCLDICPVLGALKYLLQNKSKEPNKVSSTETYKGRERITPLINKGRVYDWMAYD